MELQVKQPDILIKRKIDISVVICAYNAGDTITNALNSLRNQTIQDFEVILVDDGSDYYNAKKYEDVLQKFGDRRIKYYRIDHQGIVAARNFGNEKAEADIIALQDADDLSMPNRLERCLREFKEGIDIVYHGIYINMWDAQFSCICRGYIPAVKVDVERLLEEQYLPGACTFRKKIWQEKPFRAETKFAFDWMMYLDWILSGYKAKAINEGLYEYIRHENSASITYERDGRRKQSFEAIKKIIKTEYDKELCPKFR